MKIKIEKPTEKQLIDMGVSSWPTWEAHPSTFPWHYDMTEMCYILEGKAKVKTDEEEVEFGAGDLVTFPEGLNCEWTIVEKVRKHYKFS